MVAAAYDDDVTTTSTRSNCNSSGISMTCAFFRSHCLKVALSVLVILVLFQCGIGFIYEERSRLNEAYFTFNLTLPLAYSAGGPGQLQQQHHHHQQLQHNESSSLDQQQLQQYSASVNMTLVALQSSNSSDPFPLDLLADDDPALANNSLNITRKPSSSCPLVSPLLIGRANVSKVASSPDEIESRYSRFLSPGGRYHPHDCVAHYKVAIIIPFRDRHEHLNVFIEHMHPFLQRQQLDYGIYVVEQSGETPFNRAMLMNIGAAEALRQYSFQCFIFHDVDLLPEDDRNIYSCPEQPRHMSVAIDVFKYQLPYEGLFGGVSAMTAEHFVKVNGFSNLFWGWGGEDDDMASRIRYHKLIISRYPPSVARYTMLAHKKARPNPNRYRVMRNGAKRSRVDGLSNLKYKRLDIQLKTLYTHILVDIQP